MSFEGQGHFLKNVPLFFMAKMIKNKIRRRGQGKGHGQGHIEREIFRPFRIRHKK